MIGTIIWLTGLPCSGKTTISNELNDRLEDTVQLDGDVLRSFYTEHEELGFTKKDRNKNVVMTGEKAIMFANNGINPIVSLVSPYEKVRNKIRENYVGPFVMVHVNCPVDRCIERDVKGMWKKAMNGDIKNFTGWTDPYECPKKPDVTVNTYEETVGESVDNIINAYEEKSRVILYIGRWQPFHNGHSAIIKPSIKNKRNIVIGVRKTPISSINPYNLEQRIEMIKSVYKDEPSVDVIPFSNIKTIKIGRKVGYDIVDVPEHVKGISATFIREQIKDNKEDWKDNVPNAVIEKIKKWGI